MRLDFFFVGNNATIMSLVDLPAGAAPAAEHTGLE
jgi:hypothetical protein